MTHPGDLLSTGRLTELASALVSLRSVTGGEGPIGDFVHDFLAGLGLETRRLPVAESGEFYPPSPVEVQVGGATVFVVKASDLQRL